MIYDFNRLPDEIRDTLQSIVVAAQSGNIDDMLPVLEENELPPMLSATAVERPDRLLEEGFRRRHRATTFSPP